MTGELANGWLGTCFLPEHASVFLDDLSTGTKKAGRSLNDIDIQAGGYFEISDDVEGLINKLRPGMAFTLGAMGSAKTNFYNDAYCRAGYEEVAKEVFKKHKHTILKLDDFSDFKANYNDKVENIKSISKNLNLGLDSFVFVEPISGLTSPTILFSKALINEVFPLDPIPKTTKIISPLSNSNETLSFSSFRTLALTLSFINRIN